MPTPPIEGNLEAARRLRAKLEALLTPLGAWPHLIERRLYLGKDGEPDAPLTIIANALRVADRIKERLGA